MLEHDGRTFAHVDAGHAAALDLDALLDGIGGGGQRHGDTPELGQPL